jgi:hypothetical protein
VGNFEDLLAQFENADWRLRMQTRFPVLALLALASFSASAQLMKAADPLLDHLVGSWILQGTIAGHETTHDIEAEWVLGHEYIQLHETSREKSADGLPAYEAIVFIEWDESLQEYRCMWLDSTAGGGLTAEGVAHGKRGNDEIAFLFRDKDKDSGVNTTFVYSKAADRWSWVMDNEEGGKLKPFARVKLTRK